MATDVTVLQLGRLGWKITGHPSFARAVRDFQRGYALPGRPALLVDGEAGVKTRTAIAECDELRKQGKPTASRFFSFAEFRCKCGGGSEHCAVIRVHRDLLVGLDRYRELVNGPVSVVSGYRCPSHNQRVGGASSSQHVYGAAADVELAVQTAQVLRLRRFGGVGHKGGKVRHVDVRHVSGNNTTSGTPSRPTLWQYP